MLPLECVQEVVAGLVGRPCWRKRVGRGSRLSLGFGDAVRSSGPIGDITYGEWEVGTYYSAWRVVGDGKVLCGSRDAVDSVDDLGLALARIELGRFRSLRQLTGLDVRVEFDADVAVDFLATTSDGDEAFHIFCPERRVIVFSVTGGWEIGPSDEPWGTERRTG